MWFGSQAHAASTGSLRTPPRSTAVLTRLSLYMPALEMRQSNCALDCWGGLAGVQGGAFKVSPIPRFGMCGAGASQQVRLLSDALKSSIDIP